MKATSPYATDFGILDYFMFGTLLFISAAVGVYFGFIRPKYHRERLLRNIGEADDYLYGKKSMSMVPVALSLISSYVSGVTILGSPSVIYNYGSTYFLLAFSILVMGATVAFIYLPVFYNLQINSSYEYLEWRFAPSVRTFASLLFLLDELIFLPMIVYVPCLAFNQVTGINLYSVAFTVTLICVFYTTLGGIRAVVWTDTWQMVVMIISELVIVIWGTVAVGGFSEIWEINVEGGRIASPDFSPSLYKDYTIWAVLFGGYMYWTSFNAVHQTMVQRYLSLPTLQIAQKTVGLFTVGVMLFMVMCSFTGILIYTKYHDCDPMMAGRIVKSDQLLPLFITEVMGHVPGVTGVFISGVFGAALSSLSVVLNSASAVLLEDFLKTCYKGEISDRMQTIIAKSIIVILGIITFGSVYIVAQVQSVLEVTTAFTSISYGATMGLFTLGMLVPFANKYGAISGALCGALLIGWISLGSQISIYLNRIDPNKLPGSVAECSFNTTIIPPPVYPDQSEIFPLYRINFFWSVPISVAVTLTIGSIVSYFTQHLVDPTEKKLLSPIVHRFVKTSEDISLT